MEKKREGVSIVRESGVPVLYVQTAGVDAPSLELDGGVMAGVVDVLREHPDVQRVVFLHQRNYVYDEKQVGLLRELAQLFGYLAEQQDILQLRNLGFPAGWERLREFWRLQLGGFLQRVKSDPIGCYVEIQRVMRKEKIKIKHADGEELRLRAEYVGVLDYLLQVLGGLELIKRVKEHTSGYRVGSREIYSRIFQPLITPEFLFSRLQLHVAVEAEQVDSYQLEDGEVTIYRLPGRAGLLYHLVPREFLLDDEKYQLLELARGTLAKHRPSNQEFLQPEKMRETFFHIGQGLLRELAGARGVVLSYRELRMLAGILVRYTVGFGLLEVLLGDKKIQDVVINGPVGESCVFVVHQEYDECSTNILPAAEEGESWATKFRIMSGRPLDEANPVLDTELQLRVARARASVMQRPLSPAGLAFAFRRHRDEPWTFPLFMQNKMMNAMAAGLLSFVVSGGRSLLFAGTRGSGKTSILGATMVEILKKHRMIVLEDTQELPLAALRGLGYNIQGMKVRGALMHGGVELAADEGIRTSLRFGDSCLIVGEIRSLEARALWEAMRVGALANVVAGTIHGGDAYSVFDRVVNDLDVPRTSFKATDLIIVANPVRSADGLSRKRRITAITEVRKGWEEDPVREGGFVDLMRYDSKKDELVPTAELVQGESEILKGIAGSVKEWAGDWDAVWENIQLRARVRELLLQRAEQYQIAGMLEAGFVVASNDMFHLLSEQSRKQRGVIDAGWVLRELDAWMGKQIRRKAA